MKKSRTNIPRDHSGSTSRKPHKSANTHRLYPQTQRPNHAHGAPNNYSGSPSDHDINPNNQHGSLENANSTSTHVGVNMAGGQTLGSTQTGEGSLPINRFTGLAFAPLRDGEVQYGTSFDPYLSGGSSDTYPSPGVPSLYQIANTSATADDNDAWGGLYPNDIALTGAYPDSASIANSDPYRRPVSYTQSDNQSLGSYGAAVVYPPPASNAKNNYDDTMAMEGGSGQLSGQYTYYTENPPSERRSSIENHQGSGDEDSAGQTAQENREMGQYENGRHAEENKYREKTIESFVNGEGPWVYGLYRQPQQGQ
ncbi:hypothetical protein Daesc_001556 [Daldinia eschscholtzii]|uniref:Uncharacterized protein n=1 Tax=Daldinia eschscholtzii TaxID=292717 RepID=A0AAX6MVR4_9PEZI